MAVGNVGLGQVFRERPMIKIPIFEVTKRSGYELVTAAGDDRPIYVGSREWRERQQAAIPSAIPNRIVHRKSRFADGSHFPGDNFILTAR